MSLNRDTIVDFLGSNLGVDTSQISDETPLFTNGNLDSFSMVDLVMMLETEGGFRMTPGEVTLDNLDSISQILGFLQTKLP